MPIIRFRTIWYLFSGALIIASIVSLIMWGLNLGIDFRGGTLMEVRFTEARPSVDDFAKTVQGIAEGDVVAQPVAEQGMIVRSRALNQQEHELLTAALLKAHGTFDELRFDSIGPTIGEELRQKAIYAIIIVLLATILYVAWAFRHVSYPISSWVYGIITVITAFHDVIIPVGLFSILGHFYGVETNGAFVAAVLTIMGYSINDTIVVLDRVRENVKTSRDEFNVTVGRSVHQTYARSLNTTLTTLLALVAVYFFGGESVKYFALALIVGIATGAYSSIFIASPLLVDWYNWRRR